MSRSSNKIIDMSSQSSSSIAEDLRVSKRIISRKTCNKRLRRLRRPGPPDRLSWLGQPKHSDSAHGQSDRNGMNQLMKVTGSPKRLDRESFSFSDEEQFSSSSINLAPRKKVPLKSVDNNTIDLTIETDDNSAKRRFRRDNFLYETSGNFNSKLRDDADNSGGNKPMQPSWQCRQCTLFNPSDQTVCDACDARQQPKRNASSTGKRSEVATSRGNNISINNKFIDSDNESGEKSATKNSVNKKIRSTKPINEKLSKTETKSTDVTLAKSSIKGTSSILTWSSSHSQSQPLPKKNCSIPARQNSLQYTTQSNTAKNASRGQINLFVPTSSELWIDKHAPQNCKELCVAPKKVQEVREWLSSHISSWTSRRSSNDKNLSVPHGCCYLPPGVQSVHTQASMMILVGSPGIGKSTLALTLAKELNLEVLTWDDSQMDYVGNRWDRDITMPYQSQLASFEEFLNSGGIGTDSLVVASTGSKHNTSLESGRTEQPRGSLILIDDIPNLHNAVSANAFRGMMEAHIQRSCVPTIFIFSDVYEGKHKPDDLERLIPPHILYSALVKILPIQPVTKSKMRKCLESIAKTEKLGPLSAEITDEIHLSSRGDLRHAIFTIQFQYGALKMAAKSYASTQYSGDIISKKDVKLSSFHALGKLLYAKRLPRLNPPTSLHNHCMRNWGDGRGDLEFIPEEVLESTDMAIGSALSFVSFHSPDFFTNISDLSKAFDRLSDAGTFLDAFGGRFQGDGQFPLDYASCIGGRAVASANKNPAPQQFRQFSTPKVFDVLRKKRENELKMVQLRKRVSTAGRHISVNGVIGSANQFVTDYLPHMRCILPHEVEYALSTLHSYASNAVENMSVDPLTRNSVPYQNEVLLEDDLIDDVSW